MKLDIEFVIYGSLIVGFLLPLYVYRKKIFAPSKPQEGDFDAFLKDLKIHMKTNHPKIDIDYSIVEKTKNEPNLTFRKTFIIEKVVEQFFNFEYNKKTQLSVPRDKLWVNYDEKSIPSAKLPSDWQQRKELAWRRDNKCCNRCGCNLPLLNETYTTFVKDIKNGGSYTLENIIILCIDCNKVLNSTNPKNTMDSLILNDKLLHLIKTK
ncbi:MAG: HNH endonuclease signature motif containing protein [Arcobacter sp.]|uniref:HNH endonuclease n=1 Tax=Arcobacter sp. TaxID=1872629 RepID=UPI00258835E3|nr:HNH endonuclease signature motif containing protein [Arcobacter sp.]MDD3008390.1 HNH endonuclease signature motif containing protein [Arcobacter sp.]MDY3204495.1 HNH endonuclease signature motif containing protein [Arcobacter sp.]